MLTFLAIAGLALAVAVLLPDKYESEAGLFVSTGRESVAVDASAELTGASQNVLESREREINSELEMLRSRQLAEAVVMDLGPSRVLTGRTDPAPSDDPTEDHLDAVEKILDNISAEATPKTSILKVTYVANDPALAKAIVTSYVNAYRETRTAAYSTSGDPEFYKSALSDAQLTLAGLDQQLQSLKDQTGIADFDQQRTLLINRINDLSNGLADQRRQLASAQAEEQLLQSRLSELPERVVSEVTTGSANSSLETLRTRLSELQLEERDLASRFTGESSRVRRIRSQIQECKKLIEEAEANAEEKSSVNPIVVELRQKVETLRGGIASNTESIKQLETSLAKNRSDLSTLNEVETRYENLSRDRRIAAERVEKIAKTVDTVAFSRQLDVEKISNVKITQPASYNPVPKGPNRLLLVAVGLMMALVGAGAIAFTAESLDHNIRRPGDLERIGVRRGAIVSVPRLRSGAAIGRSFADLLDDLRHSFARLFGTAGQRSSKAARTGARGFVGTAGDLFATALRGIIWLVGSLLLLLGNVVVSLVLLPARLFGAVPVMPWLRDQFSSDAKTDADAPLLAGGHASHMEQWRRQREQRKTRQQRRKPPVHMERHVDELIVADYDEIQDIDPVEIERPEPKAAADRSLSHTARLLNYGIKRDLGEWWNQDDRPNLHLTDHSHRTLAGEVVWRSARGLLEQLLIERHAAADESGADVVAEVPRTLAIIGARPDCGTSTIANHLGSVLVDRVVEERRDQGLENVDKKPVLVLRVLDQGRDRGDGEASIESTPVEGLDIGELRSIRSASLKRAIDGALEQYEHVVVDLLPVYSDSGMSRMGMVGEAREEAGPRLAAQCELSVLIVQAEKLRREAAAQALDRLDRAGAEVAVIVLNKREYPVPQFLYKRA